MTPRLLSVGRFADIGHRWELNTVTARTQPEPRTVRSERYLPNQPTRRGSASFRLLVLLAGSYGSGLALGVTAVSQCCGPLALHLAGRDGTCLRLRASFPGRNWEPKASVARVPAPPRRCEPSWDPASETANLATHQWGVPRSRADMCR